MVRKIPVLGVCVSRIDQFLGNFKTFSASSSWKKDENQLEIDNHAKGLRGLMQVTSLLGSARQLHLDMGRTR